MNVLICLAQKVNHTSSSEIPGRYKKIGGNEILILGSDKTFSVVIGDNKKSDVVFNFCDTLSQGLWKQHSGFITLKNKGDFDKINFSIFESEQNSKDSLYFKIIFPKRDSSEYNIFKYSIITSPMQGRYNESDRPIITIAKKGIISSFALSIKNISPNCNAGSKCYQRIYFHVFEDYRPQNENSNYFTINLQNFDQCFYEAMDLEGEVLGIEKNRILWRKNIYVKIKK